jgi:hypothetical protein
VRTVFALGSLLIVGLLALSCWVIVPPFPAPKALVALSYPALVEKIGPPSGNPEEKLFVWTAGRWIGAWELRVSGFIAGQPPISQLASRCFFFGKEQRSKGLWCSWAEAYVTDKRPSDGAARP